MSAFSIDQSEGASWRHMMTSWRHMMTFWRHMTSHGVVEHVLMVCGCRSIMAKGLWGGGTLQHGLREVCQRSDVFIYYQLTFIFKVFDESLKFGLPDFFFEVLSWNICISFSFFHIIILRFIITYHRMQYWAYQKNSVVSSGATDPCQKPQTQQNFWG